MGGRVTHAGDRVRRRGRRSGSSELTTGSSPRNGPQAPRPILLRLLLVPVFPTGLAMLMPGIAGAEGEQVRGTLQTSRSGPIEGVEITVATEGGDEVATVDTDAEGRGEGDPPGP